MVYQVKDKDDLNNKFKEAGDKLVIVDFFATWCGPCKRIAPVLEEIQTMHLDKLVVLKVDVDENEELTSMYSIDIMPTFMFWRRGVHIDTVTGSNESKLKEAIEKHL